MSTKIVGRFLGSAAANVAPMSSSHESRNSTKRRGASFRSLLIVFKTVTSITLGYVIRGQYLLLGKKYHCFSGE